MSRVTALVPWYGSARMIAKHVGELLDGCSLVAIPFAGSMTEAARMNARTLIVNDKHRALMNLAKVCASASLGPQLYRRLKRKAFHPDALAEAQWKCSEHENGRGLMDALEWAEQYFVAAWMARSANAGTAREFSGGLPIRYESSGGDSAVRYRSAVRALMDWRRVLSRASFSCDDAIDLIGRIHDVPANGIYCDPPFPGPGDRYKVTIDTAYHERLATALAGFTAARVVVRYHDHPMIKNLYTDGWHVVELEGRTQANTSAAELLIVRNPATNFDTLKQSA